LPTNLRLMILFESQHDAGFLLRQRSRHHRTFKLRSNLHGQQSPLPLSIRPCPFCTGFRHRH
jgi:hypothetical protein